MRIWLHLDDVIIPGS